MGTSGLGALLVEEGLLTENDRLTIRRTSGSVGSAFARGVVALGLLDEDELVTFLAEHTRFRVAAKDLFKARDESALDLIDAPLLERFGAVPLRAEGKTLFVALPDPLDRETLYQLEFFSGYKVVPEIATFSQIDRCLEKLIKGYKAPRSELEDF